MTDQTDFNPDWVSPPGDTIRDILQERNLSQMSFACSIERSAVFVHRLLDGLEPIDEDLAQFIGPSKEFWLRREAHYRSSSLTLSQPGNPPMLRSSI